MVIGRMAAEPLDILLLALKALGPIGQVATLALAVRLARQSKRYTDAIETIERVAPLIEGDSKEHTNHAKRVGLLGRVQFLEGIVSPLARRVTAVLRGLNVPSDLSNDQELEKRIREALTTGKLSINRIAATEELVRGKRGSKG